MSEWDSAASARLADVAADLRRAGLVDQLAQDIRATWLANMQRYEPSELGDTPQLLGLLCAGNINQRVVRRYRTRPSAELADGSGVHASLPDGSLLVEACGVNLQVRKAPGFTREPEWFKFSWEESAGARRHDAAARNSRSYQPTASDQDGRPQTLQSDSLWNLDDPARLRQVSLVWAGSPEGFATSGWLGFPCLGDPAWFAVTQLWRDTSDERPGAGRRPAVAPAEPADTFTDRPEPALGLGLRPQPGQEERP